MHTERTMVPAARDALLAACPVVREGVPASDAIAGVVPSFVAFPASTDEASALLRVAAEHQLAVVARGAGTGLGWGAPPTSADLVIDLQAMDQVLEHAAGDLVARVQAGVTMGHLASVLASAGQELALDAPADATAGGVVATGTAGPRRLRYGSPRDLLIGITVVRADGMVAHSGGKVVKNVAGYDLGKLFCGSAGTLGLITEATFRLHPRPAAVAYLTAEFGPAGGDVAGAVAAAAGSALVPSAVQLDISPQASPVTRVAVLLEGTPSGVAERARRMAGLLSAAQMSDGQGSPAVSISGTPPAGWGRLPPAANGDRRVVLGGGAGRRAERAAGRRGAGGSQVRGHRPGRCGPGLRLPGSRLRPGPGRGPRRRRRRFVTALRERLAPPGGPVARPICAPPIWAPSIWAPSIWAPRGGDRAGRAGAGTGRGQRLRPGARL